MGGRGYGALVYWPDVGVSPSREAYGFHLELPLDAILTGMSKELQTAQSSLLDIVRYPDGYRIELIDRGGR